jgi:hypothetical protein
MRAAKAGSLKRDKKEMMAETQSMIWGLINEEMVSNNFISDTEDYNTILESKSERKDSSCEFLPGKNCNGLAVFDGQNLVSFDIFGNHEAYQYYFDLLAGNALSRAHNGGGTEAMKEAEPMEEAEAMEAERPFTGWTNTSIFLNQSLSPRLTHMMGTRARFAGRALSNTQALNLALRAVWFIWLGLTGSEEHLLILIFPYISKGS